MQGRVRSGKTRLVAATVRIYTSPFGGCPSNWGAFVKKRNDRPFQRRAGSRWAAGMARDEAHDTFRLVGIDEFLVNVGHRGHEVDARDLSALVDTLRRREDHPQILELVQSWSWSRTSERLARPRAEAQYVAERLGKVLRVDVQACEADGGSVRVESEPGRGTRLVFEFQRRAKKSNTCGDNASKGWLEQ